MTRLRFAAFCCTVFSCAAFPGAAAFAQSFRGAAELDAAINQALREDKIPGAVVLVGHNGQVVYRKAYGYRALLPVKEPMTVDTIFDIASLTKIVATTSGMMKLFEQGRVRIDDPVTAYLPEFQSAALTGLASPITVRDLMTHFSGLRPDLDLEPPWVATKAGIRKALFRINPPALPKRNSYTAISISSSPEKLSTGSVASLKTSTLKRFFSIRWA